MPTKVNMRNTSSTSKSSGSGDQAKIPLGSLPHEDRDTLELIALGLPLYGFNLDHRERGYALPIAHARTLVGCIDDDHVGGNSYIWAQAAMVFQLSARTRFNGEDVRCLEVLIPLYENTTQAFPSDGIAEQLLDMLTAAKPVHPSFRRGQKRVYREFDQEESLERIEDAYRELEWHLADRGYRKMYWVNSVNGEKAACRAKVLPWLDAIEEPSACEPLEEWR